MRNFNLEILKEYLIECSIITSETALEECTLLESLQIDSLDGAFLFMKIEEDYHISLPFSVYSGVTIGDLVKNIKEVLENVCDKGNGAD